MKYANIFVALLAWYLGVVAVFFITVHFMKSTQLHVLDGVIAACVIAALYFGLKDNFLNKRLGKLPTLVLLGLLLWGAFVSFIYLAVFMYGDGL